MEKKKNFVEYLINELDLREDKEFFERTFENLEFDDSEYDFGETNNEQYYAYIRVKASLDDEKPFDDKVIINIRKDPDFQKALIKLAFEYNNRLYVLYVNAYENDIRFGRGKDILACDCALFCENSTDFINSILINNNSAPKRRRFDLEPLNYHDFDPTLTLYCDYNRENDNNIISATLREVKEKEEIIRTLKNSKNPNS